MKDKLLKLASKIESKEAELVQLDQAKPQIIAQAEAKIAELAEKIPVAKLILNDASAEGVDEETAYGMRVLNGLRLKLDLLPGVRAGLVKAIEKLRNEATETTQAICNELMMKSNDDWRKCFDGYAGRNMPGDLRWLAKYISQFEAGEKYPK